MKLKFWQKKEATKKKEPKKRLIETQGEAVKGMVEVSNAAKNVDVIDCSKCRYSCACGMLRFTRSVEDSWKKTGNRIKIVVADCSEYQPEK